MAKTFKNLPLPGQPTVSKPTSERDFFDLTDEPVSAKKVSGKSKIEGNNSNTNNNGNIGNTSNKRVIPGSDPLQESTATPPYNSQDTVRQTFVLGRDYLEQLRDYVHARRSEGDYNYSQKQALQQALELLFATDSPAPPRPAQAREQEQERGRRIQQGRRSSSGE